MKSEKPAEPSPDILARRPLLPDLAAAMVFILAAFLAIIIIWRSEQNHLQIERARLFHIAGDHAHALQFNIERALSVTYSLAALVRQGKGDMPDFDATAIAMLPFFPGVSSLQLAPDGIVRRIVPLAGNENAIGHDLLKDPARTKEAFLARDTGKLTLAGPFNLLQGGVGAVGRLPVFLDNSNDGASFWGFTIALIRFPDVLGPAHLSSLEKRGFQYELWRMHPDTGKKQVIVASSDLPVNPVDSSLELPNGTWTLSVAPSGGWGDPVGLTVKIALGLIFSLLLSSLTRSLLNTRAEALRIAQKLTRDLRESEMRYQSVVTAMAEGICMQLPNGEITAINPASARILGRAPEQMLGRTPIDFQLDAICEDGNPFPHDFHPSMVTLRTGEPQIDVVMGIHRPDSSLIWISVNSQPLISDGETTPHAVVTTFHDITERKLAEEVVHRLNRQLRAISNCNRVLIQARDEQALLDEICRIICDEAGYRLAWVGYAGNDDAKTVRPVAWAGFDSGYIANIKLTWDDNSEYGQGPAGTAIRSGEIIHVQNFATDSRMASWQGNALLGGYRSGIALPIKDESKKTFGVLLIYSAEINAFSQDEIGLLAELSGDLTFGITALRTREALQKSEERLRLEVARMPIGYIVWDKDFRVVTWNPAAEGIFGFTFDEAKGRHPYETIVPPEAHTQVDDIWVRLLAGDTSAHSLNENRTKDGRSIVCEWTNTPLRQIDGTVLGVMSMVQDITERSRAGEEIRKLNRELEQRVQERTVELSERNTELNVEIHERKLAEEELRKAKTQLEESNCLLEILSVTDPLTGLANRRRFDDVLAKEYLRHIRSGAKLSMLMLDIDHFKAFNDSFGHVSGDACLQRIARLIAEIVVRPADIAARYGGEEFACILPETDLNGAVAIAEKIRFGINNLAIPRDPSTTADFVTASLGVVTVTCNADTSVSNVIALADRMLYKAKAGGRNRVETDASGSEQQSGKGKNLVQLVWKDNFCSGNQLIDTQHQELFRISNDLLDAIESLRPNCVIAEIVTHLLDEITKHFCDEETILKSVNFPGRKLHAEEHTRLYEKGLELARMLHSDAPPLGDIFKFLVYEVVFQHMNLKDREFFPFINHASSRREFTSPSQRSGC
jgi:diguanylate cyclase (GGDEF)-like protein/PAS domain S-box-containing protein/hemerythrin-like metal-binding protein